MKTHTKTLTLAFMIFAVLATTALAVRGGSKGRRGDADGSGDGRDDGYRMMSEEMGDRMLERLAETDPNEAERLRDLRDEDPEAFKSECHQIMMSKARERFGDEDGRGRQGQRSSRRTRRNTAGAGRGSDGRSGKGREMIREKLRSNEKDLVEWLGTNDPNTAKELTELKDTNRGQYMRRLAIEMKKHRGIVEAQKKNPELAKALTADLKLRDKRNKLMKQIAEATDEDEKEELTEELEDVVSQRFDVLLKKKQIQFEELKKRLEELEKQVEKSEENLDEFEDNKSDYIEERLESLTSGEKKFNWK